MGRQKAVLSVLILFLQLSAISFTVVSLVSTNWGYQVNTSPLNPDDIREVEIGVFQFCDSLRDKDTRRDDATKCVRCFNTASSKTYDTYFKLGIAQSFFPKSSESSSDSLARKGALLQTLSVGLLVSETAFFFFFLFYSQFALLLKMYRRLQNYLLLASLVSNICEVASTTTLLVLFRESYSHVDMGVGQTLTFVTVSLACLRILLIFKIARVIVKEYNRSLLHTNEAYKMRPKSFSKT